MSAVSTTKRQQLRLYERYRNFDSRENEKDFEELGNVLIEMLDVIFEESKRDVKRSRS